MANYKLTKMPWKNTLLTLFFLCTIGITHAQENLNQYDEAGKRHGSWRGYYDDANTLLKYEGQFEHGKEIGVFKFYEEGLKNPVATKTIDPGNATVAVKFLTQRGHVVSEGQMKGKHRVGTWKYYHKNSDKLMMTEVYEEDQLNGEKLVYYENGQIAEKANYIKGKLEGEKFLYSEKGVVLEHLLYENGELHGKARIYNGKGELVSEGNYKRDRHHGIWKYYEDGKLKETKEYK